MIRTPNKGEILVPALDQMTFLEFRVIKQITGHDLFEMDTIDREPLLVWWAARKLPEYRSIKPDDILGWPRSVAGVPDEPDDAADVREAVADLDDQAQGDDDEPPFTGRSEPGSD